MTISIKLFMLFTGILAVTGALFGHLVHIRYLQSRGTLIEFDKSECRVSIFGRTETFSAEDVYCVLMLSKPRHDNIVSELQLVIDGANGRQRRLLMTSIFSSPSAFVPTIQPFAEYAGIRLLKARPEGILGRGRMKVTEL